MLIEVGALTPSGVAESQFPPVLVTTFTEIGPENIPGVRAARALVTFGLKLIPVMMVCAGSEAITVSATGITTGTISVRKAVATGVSV
jgi:hypothetical protein